VSILPFNTGLHAAAGYPQSRRKSTITGMCQQHYSPSYWGSTSHTGFFGLLLIATTMLTEVSLPLRTALSALRKDLSSRTNRENWAKVRQKYG
jgi:hypothetical protein